MDSEKTILGLNYKTKICIYCILQKILFEYIYISIIYPSFSYYGFENNFDIIRYLLSWVFYLPVPYYTVRSCENETLSKQAVAFLLNIIYTPCMILFIYHSETPFIILLVIYYIILIALVSLINPINFKLENKKSYHDFDSLVIIFGIILGLNIIFIWAYYTHFHIQLSLYDVYDIRLAAREFDIPRFFVYLRAMARGVVPLLAVYCLYKKRIALCVFFIIIQFLQFCIDGSKVVLFTLVLGFVTYFFGNKNYHMIIRIPQVMTVGAMLAIIENKFLHTSFLSNFIFRRVMFVPALLNYQYYDFAQNNGLDFFRQSISLFGSSQYSISIARIIGQQYYGNSSTNANNGLFADAYINLGSIGCIIMPIAIVLIFKIIEGAGRNLPKSVWTVCVIQAFFSFTSSSFFTVLITHGVLLMIIILYILTPKVEDIKE